VNFLAHIYLSFGDPGVTLGNLIADSVRGKEYLQYSPAVRKGILLHRAIDTFTDTHPITRGSRQRLFSRYSHYSRVIVDIYYDHFLAKNWDLYSPVGLPRYVAEFYGLLEKNLHWLPAPVQRLTPYMVADNWLLNYRELPGVRRVLEGMSRRASPENKMDQAVHELREHYEDFEREFTAFFDELVIFSRDKLTLL
jgi:acyl carrier protein phosphodiesterase